MSVREVVVRAVFRIMIWIGALALATAAAHGGELNPAAVAFKVPDQIEWKSPSLPRTSEE